MSLFVTPEQMSKVKFYTKEDGASIKILKPEAYSVLTGAEKAKYDEDTVTLRPLSWGKICQLQSAANVVDSMTNLHRFDSDKFIQLKLLAMIVEWTFKVETVKKNIIVPPINEDALNALHAAVVDFILKEYRDRYEYQEED